MDRERFDSLARSLARQGSRRQVVGVLAALAGAAVAPVAAKTRRGDLAPRDVVSPVCQAAGTRTCIVGQAVAGADLKNCQYTDADLHGRKMKGVKAQRADFDAADLSGASLESAMLTSACLTNANLAGANLRGAMLTGSDLTGADLCGADLRGAIVTNAQLATASLCCTTILPNGKLAATCAPGESCCGGACRSVKDDWNNCGRCGKSCPVGSTCCNGTCTTGCNCLENCAGDSFIDCGPNGDCAKSPKPGGGCACVIRTCGDPCNTDGDCSSGEVCVSPTDCCGNGTSGFCAPPCGTAGRSAPRDAVRGITRWR